MFNFTGTTKHRNINLGGKSLLNRNKNAILMNAQAERLKREKVRKESQSAIVLQSHVRAKLERDAFYSQLSKDWPSQSINNTDKIIQFCSFYPFPQKDFELRAAQLKDLRQIIEDTSIDSITSHIAHKLINCIISSIDLKDPIVLSRESFELFHTIYTKFESIVNDENINFKLLNKKILGMPCFNSGESLLYINKSPLPFFEIMLSVEAFVSLITSLQLDKPESGTTLKVSREKLIHSVIYVVQRIVDHTIELDLVKWNREKFNLLESILYFIFESSLIHSTVEIIDYNLIKCLSMVLESIHSNILFDSEQLLEDDNDDDMDITKTDMVEYTTDGKFIILNDNSRRRLSHLYTMESLKHVTSFFYKPIKGNALRSDFEQDSIVISYYCELAFILTTPGDHSSIKTSMKQTLVARLIVLSSQYAIFNSLFRILTTHDNYNFKLSSIDTPSGNGTLLTPRTQQWWKQLYLFEELYSYLLSVSNSSDFFKNGKLSKIEFESLTIFLKELCIFLVTKGRASTIECYDCNYKVCLNLIPILGPLSIKLLKQIYTLNFKLKVFDEKFWLYGPFQEKAEISSILKMLNEDLDPIFYPDEFKLTFDPFIDISKLKEDNLSNKTPISNSVLILIYLPFMVSFKTRAKYFHDLIEDDKKLYFRHGGLKGDISRSNVFLDAFTEFGDASGRDFKGPLSVTFSNEFGQEAGIDGGGLTKEFLTTIVRNVFLEPSAIPRRLFQVIPGEYQLYPNPEVFWKSRLQRELNKLQLNIEVYSEEERDIDLRMFKFLGMIIGKCIYENVLSDISFAPFFLSKWSNGHSEFDHGSSQQSRTSVHDLKYFDSELYNNLMKLLEMNAEELRDLDLTFTITNKIPDVENHAIFEKEDSPFKSKTLTVDLISNGSNIAVDTSNRLQYIYAIAKFKLDHCVSVQSNHFLDGLYKIISPHWLSLFNPFEIQLLVSGAEKEIDIADLEANIVFGGYSKGDQTIVDLFDILRNEFTPAEKSKFVKFVTSSSKAPLLGFKELSPLFGIRNVGHDESRLPTASTCFNLLKLPDYRDKALLKGKLLYAINAEAGFDLS